MKPSFIPNPRLLGAALALVCSLTLSPTTEAKDHQGKSHQGKANQGKANHGKDYRGKTSDVRRLYASHPRSGFSVTLGTGYAGHGYYYGPPNSPYYYQRPDVMYYATRELVPRSYYGHSGYNGNSMGADVQRALARRGYYNGYVDGQIGPQSSRAIARYQRDQGLRVTGSISPGLLSSLGLR